MDMAWWGSAWNQTCLISQEAQQGGPPNFRVMQTKSDEHTQSKKKRTTSTCLFLPRLVLIIQITNHPQICSQSRENTVFSRTVYLVLWCFYVSLCVFGQNMEEGEEGELWKWRTIVRRASPFLQWERGCGGSVFCAFGHVKMTHRHIQT